MRYIAPNQPDSKIQFKSRYANFIDGNWLAPVNGQ
jgi:aldehyde dehydrogenase